MYWRFGSVIICVVVFMSRGVCDVVPPSQRNIPSPQSEHPGNIFLEEEVVSVPMPAGSVQGSPWRILNDRLEVVKEGVIGPDPGAGGRLVIGQPGIGWYRIEFLNARGEVEHWTTAAVLAGLSSPVPEDSPVCLDAALSWYKEQIPGEREKLANLAALAGVNWIRDRLRWREVQPTADTFAAETHYDRLAQYQTGLHLCVLQVYHNTPEWARQEGYGQLPADLRIVYRFCKTTAERFKGTVSAWEPWNEGNAGNFGGLTTDEMCSLQKAAYLGYKAGDDHLTVGWQPIGGVNVSALTDSILANETWPYYDTYNIHSYDWTESYESLWAPAREAACGKPIWVTESDRGMKADPDSEVGDFSEEYDRLKAAFIAQSYTCSLHAGSLRHYHFLLSQYMEQENTIQFGLLRPDLTPRRSYVALAAVGRFLAGARCLGRWKVAGKPDAFVMAFRGVPDGKDRDVLVAWNEVKGDWDQRGKASMDWTLPAGFRTEEVFDYLGRSLGKEAPPQLTSFPVFIILPVGETDRLELTKPAPSPLRNDRPSPVVIQLLMPDRFRKTERVGWTDVNDRSVPATQELELQFVVYNFSTAPVKGMISVEKAPAGCQLDKGPWEMTLEPVDRKEVKTRFSWSNPAPVGEKPEILHIRGDFGEAGKPCLSGNLYKTD